MRCAAREERNRGRFLKATVVMIAGPWQVAGGSRREEARMGRASDFSHISIIDVSDLVAGTPGQGSVAEQMGRACRESGFFYVVGHGVDVALQDQLRALSREFFAQDVE